MEPNGSRHGAASPVLPMRQVWLWNGLDAGAVGVPRPCDERAGGQTARCRGSSGGRSRRSTTKSTCSDGQRLVVRQICYGSHGKEVGIAGGTVDSCHQCCAATSSDRPQGRTQSATSVEYSGPKSFSRDVCDHAASRQVDRDSKVPLPRRCSQRGQEHVNAHNDNRFCFRPIRRAILSSYDGSTPSYNTDEFTTKPCDASPSSQAETPYTLSHNREGPVGLDGSLEEAESSRPRTLKRLRTPRQKPPSQVASRIRELELKNAIPMPKHFRPAGHTRHNHDHDSGNHRSQLHLDKKPNVDLIFPLRVRRFPRRDASGAPIRPETPLHRSVPEEEPYIHSPQPARSMPMLKDPPEHDSHPTPGPEAFDTPRGKHEEEPHANAFQPAQSKPMLRDPPEHNSHPSPKLPTLDTSRGNQDGFAVASGYGRRTSRNFDVRQNSRP